MSSRILITGGTGLLGSQVCAAFQRRSIPFRVAGRRNPSSNPDWMMMDLATGDGIDAAVKGIETIIHCASGTHPYNRAIDVEGTGRLAAAALSAGVTHFINVSIVGIDSVPMEYYTYKVAAEQELFRSGIPFTNLRATQFHELVDSMLARFLPGKINFLATGLLVQPIEVRCVAERLFALSRSSPLNRTVNIGGPQVLTARALAREWLAARQEKKIAVPVPLLGWRASLRHGKLTCPERAEESITWTEWLRRKYGS